MFADFSIFHSASLSSLHPVTTAKQPPIEPSRQSNDAHQHQQGKPINNGLGSMPRGRRGVKQLGVSLRGSGNQCQSLSRFGRSTVQQRTNITQKMPPNLPTNTSAAPQKKLLFYTRKTTLTQRLLQQQKGKEMFGQSYIDRSAQEALEFEEKVERIIRERLSYSTKGSGCVSNGKGKGQGKCNGQFSVPTVNYQYTKDPMMAVPSSTTPIYYCENIKGNNGKSQKLGSFGGYDEIDGVVRSSRIKMTRLGWVKKKLWHNTKNKKKSPQHIQSPTKNCIHTRAGRGHTTQDYKKQSSLKNSHHPHHHKYSGNQENIYGNGCVDEGIRRKFYGIVRNTIGNVNGSNGSLSKNRHGNHRNQPTNLPKAQKQHYNPSKITISIDKIPRIAQIPTNSDSSNKQNNYAKPFKKIGKLESERVQQFSGWTKGTYQDLQSARSSFLR